MNITEERLVTIETKIAFQEKTIRDLNDVIYDQQKEVARLGSIVTALTERIKDISEITMVHDAPADEKPPHY
ncbi:MAG: SlyX family protein [Pseudomonadota bacterium]